MVKFLILGDVISGQTATLIAKRQLGNKYEVEITG
jgi:hypothetical protein